MTLIESHIDIYLYHIDRFYISSNLFNTEIEHPQNSCHKLVWQLDRKVVLEYAKKQEGSFLIGFWHVGHGSLHFYLDVQFLKFFKDSNRLLTKTSVVLGSGLDRI